MKEDFISLGRQFDYGPELMIYGDERWCVTTHRLCIDAREHELWCYHDRHTLYGDDEKRFGYYYSVLALHEHTFEPTWGEIFWQGRQRKTDVWLELTKSVTYDEMNVFGIFEHGRRWQGQRIDTLPRVDIAKGLVAAASQAIERHRRAHSEAEAARLQAEMAESERAATEIALAKMEAERNRVAAIKALPRLPE